MQKVELSEETVRDILSREHQHIEELENENKELRQMRDKVIKALDSIHSTDENGSVKAYRYDSTLMEIREAVFGYEREFHYQMPWFRDTVGKLNRLSIGGKR